MLNRANTVRFVIAVYHNYLLITQLFVFVVTMAIVAVATTGGGCVPVREESGGEAAQATAKGGSHRAAETGSCDAGAAQASPHPASSASTRRE